MKLFNNMEIDFRSIVERLTDSMVKSNLISDTNTGSVAKLMAESFAREMAVFYSVLENAHGAGYLETAGSTALENVVAVLGMKRAKGQLLKGKVTFSRSAPAPQDIDIPVGTKVTGPALNGNALPKLETVELSCIPAGKLSSEVTIQEIYDEQIPPCDSLSSGSLSILPRPIAGIEEVNNPEPVTRNGKPEDDEHLRSRAAAILRESQTCTIESIEAAIRGVGIETVKVMESPDGLNGSIEIHLEDPQLQKNPERERLIRDTIHKVKAAGIYIDLKFLRFLYCQPIITVTLIDNDMPEENFEQLTIKIKDDVSAFINGIDPGTPVSKAKFQGIVISNPAIEEIVNIDLKAVSIHYNSNGSEKLKWKKDGWQIDTLENATVNPDRWPVMVIRKWPLKALLNLTITVSQGSSKDQVSKKVRGLTKEYINSIITTKKLNSNELEDQIKEHIKLNFNELEDQLKEHILKLEPTWIVHQSDGRVEDFNKDHSVMLENGEQVIVENIDIIEAEGTDGVENGN
ncbi:MAG: hypothetical protein GY714_15125 [Desulfobacterales bacterium]|nr:hypothetical protein [Desulfobacterales bacterium]